MSPSLVACPGCETKWGDGHAYGCTYTHDTNWPPGMRRETPRHPQSARFHELLAKAGAMHDRKQRDYGRGDDPFANVRASEDFGIPGWIGSLARANDKMRRLQLAAQQTLDHGAPTMANESVEDSLLDLAVYALIALVLLEEEADDGDGTRAAT